MLKQHQQRNDDCVRACVATILELPIESVPNFVAERGCVWLDRLREWLLPRGLTAINVSFSDSDEPGLGILCGAGGAGPRGCDHEVVWRDGEVVWDPYPGGGGLVGKPKDFLIFIPLDPAHVQLGFLGCDE